MSFYVPVFRIILKAMQLLTILYLLIIKQVFVVETQETNEVISDEEIPTEDPNIHLVSIQIIIAHNLSIVVLITI